MRFEMFEEVAFLLLLEIAMEFSKTDPTQKDPKPKIK